MNLCVIPSCGKPPFCRGWCATHYSRWLRHGDPGGPMVIRCSTCGAGCVHNWARFWSKVDLGGATECWNWTGAKIRGGYGRIWWGGRNTLAHRLTYEASVGQIPDGLQIDHLCRNRACVNPAHLEAVTQKTNILRGVSPQAKNALKTKCPRGHPYDASNTYLRPSGGRTCRACLQRRRAARAAQVSA